jgi:hypothetical protein
MHRPDSTLLRTPQADIQTTRLGPKTSDVTSKERNPHILTMALAVAPPIRTRGFRQLDGRSMVSGTSVWIETSRPRLLSSGSAFYRQGT